MKFVQVHHGYHVCSPNSLPLGRHEWAKLGNDSEVNQQLVIKTGGGLLTVGSPILLLTIELLTVYSVVIVVIVDWSTNHLNGKSHSCYHVRKCERLLLVIHPYSETFFNHNHCEQRDLPLQYGHPNVAGGSHDALRLRKLHSTLEEMESRNI